MYHERAPALAAVDWGTSRLRLWLLGADGAPLAGRASDEGLAAAREAGFAAVLARHLGELGAPPALPVLICGMAGSRQGWVEAPYVAMPAALTDIARGALRVPDATRDIRILPGLAQHAPGDPDVMRGEETQLMGLRALFAQDGCTVCMPGTHSKWIDCEAGRAVRLRTWMTGELFDLLARRSILRHSLPEGEMAVDGADAAYEAAVREALEQPARALSGLFGIRAGTLLNNVAAKDAAARLSGLMIGAEVAMAMGGRTGQGVRVVLVSQGALASLYARALALAGIGFETADAEAAVRAGLFEAAKANAMLA